MTITELVLLLGRRPRVRAPSSGGTRPAPFLATGVGVLCAGPIRVTGTRRPFGASPFGAPFTRRGNAALTKTPALRLPREDLSRSRQLASRKRFPALDPSNRLPNRSCCVPVRPEREDRMSLNRRA